MFVILVFVFAAGRFLFNCGARGMLQGNEYSAVYMLLLILCDFIDRVTEYVQSLKMTSVHAMYSSLMSGVISGSCR